VGKSEPTNFVKTRKLAKA